MPARLRGGVGVRGRQRVSPAFAPAQRSPHPNGPVLGCAAAVLSPAFEGYWLMLAPLSLSCILAGGVWRSLDGLALSHRALC